MLDNSQSELKLYTRNLACLQYKDYTNNPDYKPPQDSLMQIIKKFEVDIKNEYNNINMETRLCEGWQRKAHLVLQNEMACSVQPDLKAEERGRKGTPKFFIYTNSEKILASPIETLKFMASKSKDFYSYERKFQKGAYAK